MRHVKPRDPGLMLAIKTAKRQAEKNTGKTVGGVAELARIIGVRTQAISQWKRVPAHHCRVISQELGIPKSKLRPDMWGRKANEVARARKDCCCAS